MSQKTHGKNIASLFYARAQVKISQALLFVFLCGVGSTGLIARAQAAAKMPPRQPEAAASSPARVINLEKIKPLKSLSLRRTNVTNKAYEELTVQEKSAVLTRSVGGFKKTLQLEEGFFKALDNKIHAQKTYAVRDVKPQGGIKIELNVRTSDGAEKVELDSTGELKTIYADLMDLRNKVLTDGK